MIEFAGAAFAAINSVFKLVDLIIAIKEVGSENEVFVRTIQRVRADLGETERLLRLPQVDLALLKAPGQSEYIYNVLYTTKTALNEIGLYVERVRSDLEREGEVRFVNKIRWILDDHGKLENRRSELAASHLALATVLNMLHPLELAGCLASNSQIAVAVPGSPPPTYENVLDDGFMGPNQRRKRTSKFANQAGAKLEDTYQVAGLQDSRNIVPPPEWLIPPFQWQPSKEPKDNDSKRPESPYPTPSLYTSHSTNNFGPVNPWDDWSTNTTQDDAEMTSPTSTSGWHTFPNMMASSPMHPSDTQNPLPIPPKVPIHANQMDGPGGNTAPFEIEDQSKSWVTIGGPALRRATEESNGNLPIELCTRDDSKYPVADPVFMRPELTNFMPWFQNETNKESAESSTAQPKYHDTHQSRHVSVPSIPTSSWASPPTSPMNPADQNHPQIFRPRSQTDVYPEHMAPAIRPSSASPAPSYATFVSGNRYSSTPSIELSNSQDSLSTGGQPEVPGCGMGTQRMSQARRRRMMMEAAVGIHGT